MSTGQSEGCSFFIRCKGTFREKFEEVKGLIMDSTYSMIDFYSKLKVKYSEYLKKDLVSVVMIQSEDTVYLETVQLETAKSGLEKQTVKRINLDFIMDDNEAESFLILMMI